MFRIFFVVIILSGSLAQNQTTVPVPVPAAVPDPVTVTVPAARSIAGEKMDNDAFIKNFAEAGYNIACEWMGLDDPQKYKLNLDGEMSYEDVTKLAFLNKGKKLQANFLKFPEDIGWKKDLLNQLYLLFETACLDVYVSQDYMNIMRELAKIYLNSVEPRASPDPEVWKVIIDSLTECGTKQYTPYNFTTSGLLIRKLISSEAQTKDSDEDTVKTNEGNDGKDDKDIATLLFPQKDSAETVYKLDIIIDNLWHAFSHAWARCLPIAPSKELWGPRFKQLFFRDILAPLEKRWTKSGDISSFVSLIVGDFDVSRMQFNIPYCTQAAYVNPKGTHLKSQLMRPIKLASIDKGVKQFQNKKVD